MQHLPHGDGRADRRAEDRDAVMARPRTEHEIERKPEACCEERHPLQDAQGARQVAKPELIDKGERKHRVDGDQAPRR